MLGRGRETYSNARQCDRQIGSLGKSQKVGQEDQGMIKELRGASPRCFTVAWSYKALKGLVESLGHCKALKGFIRLSRSL